MGHIDAVSDALNRVPLIIAHPDFEPERVTDWVSLTTICDFFESVASGQQPSNDLAKETMMPDEGIVVVERPADRSGERYDGYPAVPDEVVQRESFRHTCMGYQDDWFYVADSAGTTAAWKDGTEQDPSATPEELADAVESRVKALITVDPLTDSTTGVGDISEDVRSDLESLGYL